MDQQRTGVRIGSQFIANWALKWLCIATVILVVHHMTVALKYEIAITSKACSGLGHPRFQADCESPMQIGAIRAPTPTTNTVQLLMDRLQPREHSLVLESFNGPEGRKSVNDLSDTRKSSPQNEELQRSDLYNYELDGGDLLHEDHNAIVYLPISAKRSTEEPTSDTIPQRYSISSNPRTMSRQNVEQLYTRNSQSSPATGEEKCMGPACRGSASTRPQQGYFSVSELPPQRKPPSCPPRDDGTPNRFDNCHCSTKLPKNLIAEEVTSKDKPIEQGESVISALVPRHHRKCRTWNTMGCELDSITAKESTSEDDSIQEDKAPHFKRSYNQACEGRFCRCEGRFCRELKNEDDSALGARNYISSIFRRWYHPSETPSDHIEDGLQAFDPINRRWFSSSDSLQPTKYSDCKDKEDANLALCKKRVSQHKTGLNMVFAVFGIGAGCSVLMALTICIHRMRMRRRRVTNRNNPPMREARQHTSLWTPKSGIPPWQKTEGQETINSKNHDNEEAQNTGVTEPCVTLEETDEGEGVMQRAVDGTRPPRIPSLKLPRPTFAVSKPSHARTGSQTETADSEQVVKQAKQGGTASTNVAGAFTF
ncbi:hypothetical protein B7494_g7932 [Chlorociboria aeruginascens]|nr:hypothetical protein B7494_g7932 [Chlorociboria aeruginascens]